MTSSLPVRRSIKWVAKYFDVTPGTILRWIHAGDLESQIINRRHMIDEAEIARFVREQGEKK